MTKVWPLPSNFGYVTDASTLSRHRVNTYDSKAMSSSADDGKHQSDDADTNDGDTGTAIADDKLPENLPTAIRLAWEQELKTRMLAVVEGLNCGDRDYSSFRYDCFTTDFKAIFDMASAEELDREQALGLLWARHPAEVKVDSCTVDISPNRAYASVYLEMEILGSPAPDLRTMGFAVFKWRRKHGSWTCYQGRYMKNVCDTAPD